MTGSVRFALLSFTDIPAKRSPERVSQSRRGPAPDSTSMNQQCQHIRKQYREHVRQEVHAGAVAERPLETVVICMLEAVAACPCEESRQYASSSEVTARRYQVPVQSVCLIVLCCMYAHLFSLRSSRFMFFMFSLRTCVKVSAEGC